MKKENILFALYVTTSIAVVAHSGVEIWKTFRTEKNNKPDLKVVKTQTN